VGLYLSALSWEYSWAASKRESAPVVALPGETAPCLSTYQASFSPNFKVIYIERCWPKSRANSVHVSVRSRETIRQMVDI
jgi:hypothetical protein